MIIKSLSVYGLFIVCSLLLIACGGSAPNGEEAVDQEELVESTDSSYFLFISDIHLNTFSTGPSEYGQDTRMDLWQMAKDKLMSITTGEQPPKFIVYTGDLPDHHPDTGADHDTNIRTVLHELVDIANGIPLFYAPGNNDPRGGDYSPYTDANCETPIDLVSTGLGYPAPNADHIYNYNTTYGYYSARPFDGLRIIALNSVMFSSRHESVYHPHCLIDTLNQDEESLEQLQWLRGELEAANELNEKVYMIMHIPPGADAYNGKSMWKNDNWVDSLLHYSDIHSSIISGVFYGHTHMDEVRRLTVPGDTTSFSAIAISAPGISPIFKNNPGFKKVFINDTYEPIDFRTFYTERENEIWGVNNTGWGNNAYSFTSYFGQGNTIKNVLSTYSTVDLYNEMIKIYMVKSPNSSGSNYILKGITVK